MKALCLQTLRVGAAVAACLLASCSGGSQTNAKRVVMYPTVDQMLAIDAEYGLNKAPAKKRGSRPLTTDIIPNSPPAVYDPGFNAHDGPLAPLPPINIPDAPVTESALPTIPATQTAIDLPPSPTLVPPTPMPVPNAASGTLVAPPLSDVTQLPADGQ